MLKSMCTRPMISNTSHHLYHYVCLKFYSANLVASLDTVRLFCKRFSYKVTGRWTERRHHVVTEMTSIPLPLSRWSWPRSDHLSQTLTCRRSRGKPTERVALGPMMGEELSDCHMRRLYTDTMADIKSLYSVSIFMAHTTIHVRHTRTHTTAKANAAHKHYCNFFSTTATVFSTVFIAVSINMITKFSGERWCSFSRCA